MGPQRNERFGHNDYLATYSELLRRRPGPRWLVVGDTPPSGLPVGAIPFASVLEAEATIVVRPSSDGRRSCHHTSPPAMDGYETATAPLATSAALIGDFQVP